LVKARDRKNENDAKRYHADSELIEIYRNDSSALNPDEVSRAEELVKARDRKTENQANRYHADSMLIEIYRSDSSALNPADVSRAKELVKARDRKNENDAKRKHAQRAAAKGGTAKWTCVVCKSCSFDTFEEAVAHESQCYEKSATRYHVQRAAAKGGTVKWTCDVCKSCSFDTSEEAVDHESQCDSALNPDEVSRVKELVKARDRKNEKEATRYHVQRAAAKGGTVKWTCDVCKSCSFDTFEEAVDHESQCDA
jgi:predicted Zn-ribbon and HTH transcriptional regulator